MMILKSFLVSTEKNIQSWTNKCWTNKIKEKLISPFCNVHVEQIHLEQIKNKRNWFSHFAISYKVLKQTYTTLKGIWTAKSRLELSSNFISTSQNFVSKQFKYCSISLLTYIFFPFRNALTEGESEKDDPTSEVQCIFSKSISKYSYLLSLFNACILQEIAKKLESLAIGDFLFPL